MSIAGCCVARAAEHCDPAAGTVRYPPDQRFHVGVPRRTLVYTRALSPFSLPRESQCSNPRRPWSPIAMPRSPPRPTPHCNRNADHPPSLALNPIPPKHNEESAFQNGPAPATRPQPRGVDLRGGPPKPAGLRTWVRRWPGERCLFRRVESKVPLIVEFSGDNPRHVSRRICGI